LSWKQKKKRREEDERPKVNPLESVKRKLYQDELAEEEENIAKRPKSEERDSEEETNEEKEKPVAESEPGEIPEEGLSQEERIEIFKQMLREKKITPFGSWEKELPKFAFDPRFKILPNHKDRRSVFSEFVKNRVGEERKERKDKLNAARNACKQGMENKNSGIDEETSLSSFSKILSMKSKDFKDLPEKDKEKMFNEFIAPLKKEKKQRELSHKNSAQAEFRSLLRDTHQINPGLSWSKAKSYIENDSRYKSKYLESNDKEDLFREYIEILEEDERKKRKEVSQVKEREKEISRLRSQQLEAETMMNYKILLKEKIKDPEASWTKSKKFWK